MVPLVIDVHAHLMSEDFQRDKQVILQAMERYQVEKTYVSALGGYVPNPEESGSSLGASEAMST